MKRSLPLLLLTVSSLVFNGNSQEDTAYIEFVPSGYHINNRGVIFASNGYYKLQPEASYTRVIPGIIPEMMRITPERLVYNDTLITASHRYEMMKNQTFYYPLDYYTEISKQEYDQIMAPAIKENKNNASIEELRKLNEVKFKDISDADKKRREARYNLAEVERLRIQDSIINVKRRKLLLDPIKTPVPVIEGLDTLPIPDPTYYKKTDYFEAFPNVLDSVQRAHRTKRSEIFQSSVDEILRPFYIAKKEVTNKDYREFINFLTDSIYLHHAYWNVNNDSLALTLINCGKKMRDSLDPKLMKQNFEEYGLKNPYKSTEEFIRSDTWAPVMDTLYYSRNDGVHFYRYEFRKELLLYPDKTGKMIQMYPNAKGFEDLRGCLTDQTIELYNWHADFDDDPVLNLSYNQIEVYCSWREKQLKEKYKKQGYDITVGVPTISDYEFALKSVVPNSVNELVVDQDNSDYIESLVDCDILPLNSNKEEKGIRSMIIKEDLTPEEFRYQEWLRANTTGNLESINGGASEYSSTPVTEQLLIYYDIPIPKGKRLSDYVFVLGTNYRHDVFTKSGTSFTKIFYKKLQRKDEGTAYNGFRLVYKIVPLD